MKKKRPFFPRRDVNRDWCFAAGMDARDHGKPMEAIAGLSLLGDFGSTRGEDLERAWREGWNRRDAELRQKEIPL